MSWYGEADGNIEFTNRKMAHEFCEDINKDRDEYDLIAFENEEIVEISGYDNHLSSTMDDMLEKYNQYIVHCEIFGKDEDGSEWRWRKLSGWDKTRVENKLDIYEGDTIEKVSKELNRSHLSISIL